MPSLQAHIGLGDVPAIAIAAFLSAGKVAGVVEELTGTRLAGSGAGSVSEALAAGSDGRKAFCVRFSMAWMACAISCWLWLWFLQPTHWQRSLQRPLAAKHSQ